MARWNLDPAPGTFVPDKGVFVDRIQIDRGRSGGLAYRSPVYAAKTDLRTASGLVAFSFVDATREVGNVKKLHGHDGRDFLNEDAFKQAWRDGSYGGQWIVATLEMMQAAFKHRNVDAFADTFARSSEGGRVPYYGTSTEVENNADNIWALDFRGGEKASAVKNHNVLSYRLFRVDVAPQ